MEEVSDRVADGVGGAVVPPRFFGHHMVTSQSPVISREKCSLSEISQNIPKSARFVKFLGNDAGIFPGNFPVTCVRICIRFVGTNTKSVDCRRDPSYDDEFFSCP